MKQESRHRPWIVRKSFLLTMIFSIIMLICIPLVAVQLWLVQQSANELKASNTDAYIAALRNNAHSYNSQMEMLDYNALKISADKTISKPLNPKATGYDLFLAAQVVKGYSVGLPSVEEIGFYYPGKDSFLMNGYKEIYQLITNNADIIAGGFCGHTHNDFYTEIKAKTASGEETVIPQYILIGVPYGKGHALKITVE